MKTKENSTENFIKIIKELKEENEQLKQQNQIRHMSVVVISAYQMKSLGLKYLRLWMNGLVGKDIDMPICLLVFDAYRLSNLLSYSSCSQC